MSHANEIGNIFKFKFHNLFTVSWNLCNAVCGNPIAEEVGLGPILKIGAAYRSLDLPTDP